MKRAYQELIDKATVLANPHKQNAFCTLAYVGSALITHKGNTYTGVSIDAACGIGFCAEHSAIAAMVTQGETRIQAVVAIHEQGLAIGRR